MKEKYYVVAKTITKWKLNNLFENWLGYKADTSEFWKKIYVFYYRLFDYKYYSKGIRFINEEIAKQRPNLKKRVDGKILTDAYLRRDLIYSLHRFGINFFEYFVYKFYNKNFIGREKINNLRIQYGYCELVNAPFVRELFENKSKTYEYLKSFYKRDLVTILSVIDYQNLAVFIEKHNLKYKKNIKRLSTPAINMLMSYHWPGNVRELENCIERAVITATDDCIHGYNLPASLQTGKTSNSSLLPEGKASFNTLVDSYERELIVEALKQNHGNMSAAARDLDLSPRVIHYKIHRLGITPKWYQDKQ